MASSLGELLAEEGFRGKRSGMRSRSSFKAEAATMPFGPFRDQHRTNALSGHITKSDRKTYDVARRMLRGELPGSHSSSSSRPRDNLIRREKIDGRSKTEKWERVGHRGSHEVEQDRIHNVDSSEDIHGREIVEVGVEEGDRVKDIYSDKAYNSEKSESFSKGYEEKERFRGKKGKEKQVVKMHDGNSNKTLLMGNGFGDSSRKSMQQRKISYESSVRGLKNAKSFENDRKPKHKIGTPAVSELALDEVAVQAIVSILNGYIKRFLKDEEFRTMLHKNCYSSLNCIEMEEGQEIENKVMTNLEQAIEIVEKAAKEAAREKDLQKASLQLSVISGLNSNDLKDRYTSGIPNSRLSACAHLYLSVIYKLQKKDRISAKHLLQVFCDSPFLARTLLLSELWDYLFFPHLSHLKVWYNQEADSLLNTPSKIRKLQLIDKVYNEILDSGTYQFAVYYKDWVTEGVEAPSLPSIVIPTISVQGTQQGGSCDQSLGPGSPSGPFSPRPMVSKKLYDAVFAHASKPAVYEAEDDGEEEYFNNGVRSSDASSVEVKETLTYSSEIVKYLDQDIEKRSSDNSQDNTFLPNPGLLFSTKEAWNLVKMDVSQENVHESHMLITSSYTKANEITLKSLAKSVFELQQTEDSGVLTVSALSDSNEPFKERASYEELHGSYQYFDEEFLFASIPQDFICPLTGQLFDDPVTLETGQTFEREAVSEWFNQGNRTCPVTGKTLECLTVPHTNFILKRVINGWISKHSHLLEASQIVRNSEGYESRERDESAIFLLEKLLSTCSGEERLMNVKHLISIGGLEVFIKRFKFGNLEEKTCVAALLSCCIEAVGRCRHQIATKIDRQCLFDLLHSMQSRSRRIAVLLLTELVCLSRRKDVLLFLSGLQSEEIMNAMRILLVYLQNSPPEERPLIAVLLLHLDLLVEPRKYSIYTEEAVNAIAVALEGSLTDEKVRDNSCRALLTLGGRFSASGKLLTECSILKQAGFNKNCQVNLEEDNVLEDEEDISEEWLRNLSVSLLGSGKKSFLETLSKGLGSGILDLVRACLTTIAWLTCTLSSLPNAEFQLSAFSALISGLKGSLEYNQQIEHKVLASVCLLNFTKVPECRILLMTIAEEIAAPLRSLGEVTWTAKQLYAIISGENL